MIEVDVAQQLISTLGFPIFVAVWMMYRDYKKDEEMKEVIEQNTKTQQKVLERVNK